MGSMTFARPARARARPRQPQLADVPRPAALSARPKAVAKPANDDLGLILAGLKAANQKLGARR